MNKEELKLIIENHRKEMRLLDLCFDLADALNAIHKLLKVLEFKEPDALKDLSPDELAQIMEEKDKAAEYLEKYYLNIYTKHEEDKTVAINEACAILNWYQKLKKGSLTEEEVAERKKRRADILTEESNHKIEKAIAYNKEAEESTILAGAYTRYILHDL